MILKLKEKCIFFEQIIASFYKKYCGDFVFALAVGILTHFVYLAEYLFNHDSVATYYSDSSWLIVQGKWFAGPISLLKGSLASHYIVALLGMVVLAVTAIMIVELIELSNNFARKSCIALFMVFPSVAVCLNYNGLDYFAITAFLAVSAVFAAKKKTVVWTIVSIILLTLSLGSYQGYIGFTAAIFVIFCIIELSDTNNKISSVVKEGLYYIGILIISMICYYAVLKITTGIMNIDLSAYKGINDMTQILDPKVLIKSIAKAYKNVMGYLWNYNLKPTNAANILINRLFTIVVVAVVVKTVITLFAKKEILRGLIILVLYVLVFPLATNIVGVLSQNTSYYYVTAYPLVILFIGSIKLLFTFTHSKKSIFDYGARFGSGALVLLIIGSMFILNNRQYEKARFIEIQINSKVSEMVSAIHDVEGITHDTKVVFVGEEPYDFLKSYGVSVRYRQEKVLGFDSTEEVFYDSELLKAYLKNILAFELDFDNYENYQEKYDSLIKEMPVYPDRGALRFEDNIVFVKLNDKY